MSTGLKAVDGSIQVQSGFESYTQKRLAAQAAIGTEASQQNRLGNNSIGVDEIAKVYDNFFRENFKDHPKFAEIQTEYLDFKTELLQLATDLSDEDFHTYATRKASFMKNRIAQLCVIPPQHTANPSSQFSAGYTKNNFFFDFIRNAALSERQFDEFTSGFRNRPLREVVKDGLIANLSEFGKSVQPLIFRDMKKVVDIRSDLNLDVTETQSIISLLRLAEKQNGRVVDFAPVDEYNPLLMIFAGVFITSLEKPLHSFRLITDYLLDLYNLSQFYSIKTPHQQAFDKFSKYLQQLLQEATTKNFENDSSYHGYILGLFYRTLHNPEVLKGIKLYLAISIKTFLEYMNPTLILSILGLNPAATGSESPNAVRSQLLDFITNHLEREPRFTKADEVVSYLEANKAKILKLVKVAGYCLSGSFECATFFGPGSGPFTVCSPYKSETENSFVICAPADRLVILGYGDQSKQLIDILKKTEPAYGIEDFLSVSENESSSGRLTPPPMERRTGLTPAPANLSTKPSLVPNDRVSSQPVALQTSSRKQM